MTLTVKNSRRNADKLSANLSIEFPDEAAALCDRCDAPQKCRGICVKVAKVINREVRKNVSS